MSGYDLSRSYQRALQQIWYAPLGRVYPTLRKMRAEKLLRVTVQDQHDRPNQKVYSLTNLGRRIFVDWLSLPAVLPNMQHEFIHKLFLLNYIDRKARLELMQDYVERCTAWAGELRQIDRKLEHPSMVLMVRARFISSFRCVASSPHRRMRGEFREAYHWRNRGQF